MLRLCAAALTMAVVCGASGGCNDEEAEGPPEATAAPATASPKTSDAAGGTAGNPQPEVTPVPPTYPDSVQGLESLMRSLVGAVQNDDTAEEARLLESMRLEDPKAWFAEIFEARIADRLVAEYEPLAGGIGHLVNALKGPIDAGQTDVKADRFDAPDMQGATGYQQAALAHMKKKVALYSVAPQHQGRQAHVPRVVLHPPERHLPLVGRCARSRRSRPRWSAAATRSSTARSIASG
jgi:hypothetical protein